MRKSSLDPVVISAWRWDPFLDYAIHALQSLNPEAYKIAPEFLEKEAITGSKLNNSRARTLTWACKTKKLRQIRAACVEAGNFASVLNLVISPLHIYDLPFFGADFVSLPSGHLIALDLQPVLKTDSKHTLLIWKRLAPLFEKWKDLIPAGGKIPSEARQYFSPGFLWTRLPLGDEGDKLIYEVIFPAFKDYLDLYLEFVFEASKVSNARSKSLLTGQKGYLTYRAENDPARGMLNRFYGREWTDRYIHKVLFDL